MKKKRFLLFGKKNKIRYTGLDCEFNLSEGVDELLDNIKEQTSVTVDGIIGNDFMARTGYIVDYHAMALRHGPIKISIKDAMDIASLPLIVLWQNGKKYIFLIDTGATLSLLHSRCLENGLIAKQSENQECEIIGYGGSGTSSKMVIATLFYREKT